jgi:hypothetical protein
MKRFKHQGGKGPRLCFLSGTCKQLQAERHGGAVPVKRHAGGAGTHTGHTHGYTRDTRAHKGTRITQTTSQPSKFTKTQPVPVQFCTGTGTGKRGHSVR